MIRRYFKAWLFHRAVRKAEKLHRLTGYCYLVLNCGGKLKVIARKDIRSLVRRQYFRPGVGIGLIERIALYKTK